MGDATACGLLGCVVLAAPPRAEDKIRARSGFMKVFLSWKVRGTKVLNFRADKHCNEHEINQKSPKKGIRFVKQEKLTLLLIPKNDMNKELASAKQVREIKVI